jgi:hypothetical protein
MLVLSRKPGEAVIVGRSGGTDGPRLAVPPFGLNGRGSSGGAGPAPCPASAPVPGRRLVAIRSRPGARLGRAARRQLGPAPDVTAQGRSPRALATDPSSEAMQRARFAGR